MTASVIPDGLTATSVSTWIGESIAGLPHVLLRDSEIEAGPGPVLKPSSPEMPDLPDRSARLQLIGEMGVPKYQVMAVSSVGGMAVIFAVTALRGEIARLRPRKPGGLQR